MKKEEIQELVQQCLQHSGMQIKELAAYMGVSDQRLYTFRWKGHPMPSESNINRLQQLLRTPPYSASKRTSIAAWVRASQLEKSLSALDMARYLGLAQATYQNLVNRKAPTSVSTLKKIIEKLEVKGEDVEVLKRLWWKENGL